MADYFSPTVIQPTIPLGAMTPLERLLLSHIFTCEPDGDGLYFYAEQGVSDMPAFPIDAVRAALEESGETESIAADVVREALANLDDDDAILHLDLTESHWETFFQSVVRRHPTLAYVSALSAWTCTKMRPDGFGGMAILITADDIMARSTESMLDEMLGIAEYGPLGVEPGLGSHVLLSLCEEHIQATVAVIFESEAPGGVTLADVTANDIRQGALDLKASLDLSHQESDAAFRAACRAIQIAADRTKEGR
ncbi:hypothetical protein [Sphingobium baderi]|uniref:Uncharacterized protein n=1 Tax=Sphingobium baderi TaxID=1332080 RepID=A0A0S3EZT8_9SPHN|nr:hypothetical protein [Sphingobium baderi]ALR20958.1 hypothetical protein ATN00_12260 [Sphingobium baderi]